jgi:hypothetical protein
MTANRMTIDIENKSPKYWAKVLQKLGLSEKRGLQPNLISYMGTSQDLVALEERNAEDATGRVSPRGHGPDA